MTTKQRRRSTRQPVRLRELLPGGEVLTVLRLRRGRNHICYVVQHNGPPEVLAEGTLDICMSVAAERYAAEICDSLT